MTDSLNIVPVVRPVIGAAVPPGSKSLTNRALVCAALAEGPSTLRGALDSEDTQVMIAALRSLGVGVEASDRGRVLRVPPPPRFWPVAQADLYVANSGTTMRFLAAAVAAGQGEFRLDGVPRMRQRPIGDLLAALRQLGVDAAAEAGNDCPPVVIRSSGLAGGEVRIAGALSSQFLSGLMMAAPAASAPVRIVVEGELVSRPYVDMTAAVMRQFGAVVECSAQSDELTVDAPRRYVGREYAIEPDASAASYFFAVAAVTGGEVTVRGLSRRSLQGDVDFCDCLARMGAEVRYDDDAIMVRGGPLHGVDVDMNAVSDTAPTLAVVALFAAGPTTIRNVAHMRHKETDRIAAAACELRKLGAQVEEFPDGLRIRPGAACELHGAEIATYDDHRMAMSFAVAGLRIPDVTILNPKCVEKTYPEFFADLAKLTAAAR